MTKRIRSLALLMAMMLFMSTTAGVFAEQKSVSIEVYYTPIHFVFDEKEYGPPEDQRGFIYDGNTYVPLRFLAYVLDKAVRWDGKTYTVTVEEPNWIDKVVISEYKMNRAIRDVFPEKLDRLLIKPESIDVYMERLTYVFDGEEKAPSADLPGFIYEGSTYVPLRFFSESLGHEIGWDSETYTVSGTSVEFAKLKAEEQKKVEEQQKLAAEKQAAQAGTPAAGGGIGGGGAPVTGGGGGTVKPSKESIHQKYIDKGTVLENRCTQELSSFFITYINVEDKDHKQLLLSQGKGMLNSCITQFEQLVDQAVSEMSSNGYTTEIREEMYAKFIGLFEAGEVIACGSVGCTGLSLGGGEE